MSCRAKDFGSPRAVGEQIELRGFFGWWSHRERNAPGRGWPSALRPGQSDPDRGCAGQTRYNDGRLLRRSGRGMEARLEFERVG